MRSFSHAAGPDLTSTFCFLDGVVSLISDFSGERVVDEVVVLVEPLDLVLLLKSVDDSISRFLTFDILCITKVYKRRVRGEDKRVVKEGK